jgi:hypothetical protein
MNLKKLSTTVAASLFILGVSASAVTITTFGNVSSPTFTSDSYTTFSSVTQSASSIDISGTDLQVLSGTFNTVDLTSVWGNSLTLIGTAGTAPSTTFNITLYDAENDTAVFTGGAWSDLNGMGQTLLSLFSETANFDADTVYAMELATGGGGDSVVANFTGLTLSAVPEPSTFAALAGLCALGAVMVRRRRV